jgi:hypothetical protein
MLVGDLSGDHARNALRNLIKVRRRKALEFMERKRRECTGAYR